MTKIVFTADLHGTLPEIPKCDVLVIAGDICPDFEGSREQRQRSWLEAEFNDWLTFDVDATHVIGIAGNHDFVFQKKFLVPNLPWTYLEDNATTVAGLKFWGTPHVPHLPYWAFPATESELEDRARKIPNDVDILITHGPPLGYGDRTISGQHVGDRGLADELLRINPKQVVCGHIHEGYGEYKLGHIPIVNVALNTVRYVPSNSIVVKEF